MPRRSKMKCGSSKPGANNGMMNGDSGSSDDDYLVSFEKEIVLEEETRVEPRRSKRKCGSSKPGAKNGMMNGDSGSSDDDDPVPFENEFVPEEKTRVEPEDKQETEDKLKQCIDNLMDKCAGTRLAALESLRRAFCSRVLNDFLIERCLTISDCLKRSLKTGGGVEQAAAATVFSLLCVQLGGEWEEGFKTLRPTLSTIVMDSSASISARQSCARALGVCCYVSSAEEDLIMSMSHLESVFMSSYPNREETLPTPEPGNPGFYIAALQSWALLLTQCPASRLCVLLDLHLPKLQACLESSSDVNYRIAVGETMALLVELGHNIDSGYEVDDSDGLCKCLKGLANCSTKHRAKNDLRKMSERFRKVLHYMESDDFTERKIRFGVEGVNIDSWTRRIIYNAFKEILESGVRHHLQFNSLLRDIFGLGPPVIPDTAVISCSERHLFNSSVSKARTKLRNKERDKRADFM